MKEKVRKKLTSRKFWATLGTAAYFAAMAIKEQNEGNQLATIVFGICVGAVIVAWVLIEGFLDDDDILADEVEDEIDEEETEDEAA